MADLTPKQRYVGNAVRAAILTKALANAALIVAVGERSRYYYDLSRLWDYAAMSWLHCAAHAMVTPWDDNPTT